MEYHTIPLMEYHVIEPARIVTSGKVKTDVNTVIENINFWNELHRLGLANFREKSNAATWNIANCVIAIRGLQANITEFHLLVARRQANYRWTYGLQPEEAARESWNRILQLMPREMWDASYRPLDRPLPQIRRDVADLVGPSQMSELARLVHISEIAQAQFGADSTERATTEEIAKVNEQIAQAETFKREQDALIDLTPEQLADVFLQMIPESKTAVKRVRRRTKTKKAKDDSDSVSPKRKTTEAEWRRDWKLIEPLFNQRQKIGVIAGQLNMTRERVSAIIAWATAKPK